jgi:hypothetical protein
MKFLCVSITSMIVCVLHRVLAQRLIPTKPPDVDRPPQVVEIPLEEILNPFSVVNMASFYILKLFQFWHSSLNIDRPRLERDRQSTRARLKPVRLEMT